MFDSCSVIQFAVNQVGTHIPIPLLKILRVNDPQVLVSLTKSKNPVKRKKAVQTLGTIHHWPGIYLMSTNNFSLPTCQNKFKVSFSLTFSFVIKDHLSNLTVFFSKLL